MGFLYFDFVLVLGIIWRNCMSMPIIMITVFTGWLRSLQLFQLYYSKIMIFVKTNKMAESKIAEIKLLKHEELPQRNFKQMH